MIFPKNKYPKIQIKKQLKSRVSFIDHKKSPVAPLTSSSGAEIESTDFSRVEATTGGEYTSTVKRSNRSVNSLLSFSNEVYYSSELDSESYAPGEVRNINPAGYEPEEISNDAELIFTGSACGCMRSV